MPPEARRSSRARGEEGKRQEWVAFPFTIEVVHKNGATELPVGRSWGDRLGLWWQDSELGDSGVVITGIKPSIQARQIGAILVGDVVVEVEGHPVENLGDISRRLEEAGPGPIKLSLRRGARENLRSVELEIPTHSTPPRGTDGSAPRETTARVVRSNLQTSIRLHIESILSNPVQGNVHAPGIAPDPGFGCVEAEVVFSVEKVGLSAMKNAIERCEPRIREVELSRVGPGLVRMDALLVVTGKPVSLEFEITELAERRSATRRREDSEGREWRTP